MATSLWWEAESSTSTNFSQQNPFAPENDKAAAALSAGKWIGAERPGKVLFAEYDIVVPKGGTYDLYARKFWQHGPFKWRFDAQPWKDCGRDVALLDDVSIAKFVNVNWVGLGPVTLAPGHHTLRIELPAGTEAVAFDCFLLTDGPFAPRGKLKPGEKSGAAPAGWFAFEPDPDAFGPSPIDLRSLNENKAGDGGFIQVKGDGFVHGKTGQPVRFWAVNAEHEILGQTPTAMDRFARHLAKLGVNMVRLHGPLWREDDVTKVDGARLAKLHRLVAALKNQGIYLTLSSYFPLWLPGKNLPGFAGYSGDMKPFAIPFFNPRFQELQKGWWRTALTTVNPATGLTLLQDPALAFVEIVNEDGLFFWTFTPYEKVPAPQIELLEKRFGQWLKARHGGIEQALARWAGPKIRGDAAGAGRVGLMPLYDIFGRKDARARDTAEFLADVQRDYYERMYGFLKRELGFRGAVSCSNWITAEPRVFGPLDKWSNTACDFMDRHGYYGGPHEGERADYLLSKDDRYDDASALLFHTGRLEKSGQRALSFDLPIMDLAYNGKPSTNSELNWVPPNRFRADMPLLAAAYGALQGSDGLYFFATGDPEWSQRLTKFSIANPVAMGQFPAAALLFRKGLVRTADVAVRIEARLSDLRALQGIPLSAPQNPDELRRRDAPAAGTTTTAAAPSSIDPLAFLVGRVEVNVTAQGGRSQVTDLSTFIDRDKKLVRSATGELRWDYRRGVATVAAPAAQGITGFLSQAGATDLGDVTVESPLEYGAIVVVAMDDRPLGTSRKMLVQVMSEDNNLGWAAPGQGLRRIADVGGPPLVVKKLAGKITLKRADAAALKVDALDANGYVVASLSTKGAGTVTLLPTTMYYVIHK